MNNFFSVWSVALIIILCFGIWVTRESWKKLVEELSIKFNKNGLKANRDGKQNIIPKDDQKKLKELISQTGSNNYREFEAKLDAYVREAESIKIQKQSLQTEKNQIFSQWVKYMFAYLNLFLVPNSKVALLWIYNNPNLSKKIFMSLFVLPAPVENTYQQKEIIISVLISENLVQKNEQGLYTITNIGRDFLKYIGSINYDSI